MSTATETTDLATREKQRGELAITPQQAMAQKEIEGALIVARRFPRNEDDARGRLLDSCKRPKFASMVRYSYPRGGSQVQGASVYLAREAARVWGNIRYGFDIVHDDEEIRTVRAWAWDLETNTKRQIDATFKKLVYRKKGGWTKPDERDLRELTNKQGETAVRNSLLHILPPDLVDDAMEVSLKTLSSEAAKDPAEARKKLALAFRGIGVTAEDLETYLGHKLAQITPDEVADLRGIWKSIADGNSKWHEYMADKEPEKPAQSGATMEDLAAKTPEGDADGKPQEETGAPAPATGTAADDQEQAVAAKLPAAAQDEQPSGKGAPAEAETGQDPDALADQGILWFQERVLAANTSTDCKDLRFAAEQDPRLKARSGQPLKDVLKAITAQEKQIRGRHAKRSNQQQNLPGTD